MDLKKLKTMITGKKTAQRTLYQATEDVENFTSYINLANKSSNIPIERDDRRNVLFQSQCPSCNLDDWAVLMRENLPALAYMFENTDLAGFDPRVRPKTELAKEQKEANLQQETQFIHAVLQAGCFENVPAPQEHDRLQDRTVWEQDENTDQRIMTKDSVFALYCSFLGVPKPPAKNASCGFFRKLKKILPYKDVHRGSRGNQVACCQFGTLDEMRLEFQQYIKEADWAWDQE
jgi:hypothetical protein